MTSSGIHLRPAGLLDSGSTNYDVTNSVALVRERTTPTERLQVVGEVSANFCREGCRMISTADPLRP
jgi:hypothetical protein